MKDAIFISWLDSVRIYARIRARPVDQDCCSVCGYEAEKIVELKSLTSGHWSHYYSVCCYVATLENCAKGVWVHVPKDSSGPG